MEMDSRQFAKLCRDAGLLSRKLTPTACDLAFAKLAKAKVSRLPELAGIPGAHLYPFSSLTQPSPAIADYNAGRAQAVVSFVPGGRGPPSCREGRGTG